MFETFPEMGQFAPNHLYKELLSGDSNAQDSSQLRSVMEPYIGEIRCFAFGKIPNNWLPCEGQTLQGRSYQALFALLGKTYGGDGMTTFNLPDLRGRVPMHYGAQTPMATKAGIEIETLSAAEMPAHSHPLKVNNAVPATFIPPSGNYISAVGAPALSFGTPGQLAAMAPGTLSGTGGGTAHTNMQPFLVLSFCIATSGLWPQHP